MATALDLTNPRALGMARLPVAIRAARPADGAAIAELVDRLRAERAHSRYHATGVVRGEDAVGCRRELVAVAGDRVVGLAGWMPDGDGRARATLAVAEGWRLTDLGPRLLVELGRHAAAAGVHRFRVEIVPRNAALRAAARALGLPEHRSGVAVEIDVTALA